MARFEIDLDLLSELQGAEKMQALELVAEFRRELQANPLQAYVPWHDQIKVHAQIEKEIRGFIGGNRAGKTTMGIADDVIQVTPREHVPEHLLPFKRWECPCYIRIVNPASKLQRRIIVPKLREMLPIALLKDQRFDRSYEKFDGVIRLECGCRIDLMTYEQELDKFGGDALHRVHYDEEPPQDIREECFARTLDYGGEELFTMTPLQGMSWMYDDIILAAEKPENDHMFVVAASMLDNPYLATSVQERIMRMWAHDPQMFAARVLGHFVHYEGMVYPDLLEWFVDPFKSKEIQGLDLLCGIDPGVVATGLCWGGFHENNNLDIFADRKMLSVDVAEVAAGIRETEERWGIRGKVRYVIDPAARARGLGDRVRLIDEYANQGINCAIGNNDREAGVAAIRRRGHHGGMRISRACQQIEHEGKRYRIQQREDGRFDVIKKNDHVMDAWRYLVMERPYDPPAQRYQEPEPGPNAAFGPNPKRELIAVEGEFV